MPAYSRAGSFSSLDSRLRHLQYFVEKRRRAAELGLELVESREQAYLDLGRVVCRDRRQQMLEERIAEAIQHLSGELGRAVNSSLQHRHDFLKQQSFQPRPQLGRCSRRRARSESLRGQALMSRAVWRPLRIRTLRRKYGCTSFVQTTGRITNKRSRFILNGPQGIRFAHGQESVLAPQRMIGRRIDDNAIDQSIQPDALVLPARK